MNDKVTSIECIECKKTFTISEEEKEWFLKKGLLLPKRCRDCRVNKRKKYYEENNS